MTRRPRSATGRSVASGPMVLLSPPIPVEWGGFRSDTALMQRSGWVFGVESDEWRHYMRVVAHHPKDGVWLVSGDVDARQFCIRYGNGVMFHDLPFLPMALWSRDTRARIVTYTALGPLSRVDATPTWAQQDDVPPWQVFAELNAPAPQQIIIPSAFDVSAALNQILDAQAPGMREIRDRDRRRARDDVTGAILEAKIFRIAA